MVINMSLPALFSLVTLAFGFSKTSSSHFGLTVRDGTQVQAEIIHEFPLGTGARIWLCDLQIFLRSWSP